MKRIIRDVVVLGVAGLAVANGTVFGESAIALRQRYGKPISETFVVRPGIGATATYGTGGRIVKWVISPLNTDVVKSRGRTLSREVVESVLDELVPPSRRGKHLSSGILNGTCMPDDNCGGSEQLYQNVTIYYNPGKDGFRYAVVQWRR